MKKKHEYVQFYEDIVKLLRIMKLTVLFVIVMFVQSFANSYAQTTEFSFTMEDATLKEVVEHLEEESEFYFFLKQENDILNKKVSVDFENNDIEYILDELLENTDLSYKIIDKYIAIMPADEIDSVPVQENKVIKGKVSDESGLPLPGVSVVIKGTTQGIISDIDGNFSLEITDNAEILLFSFIGMESQDIVIGEQTVINVVLKVQTVGLEEVVAIGYGLQKKSSTTGAISKVESESIQKYATGNFEQALAGVMSGVQVTQGGRNIGDDSKITIRGLSTITAGSNPLIVVDGVPLTEGSPLNSINSNDIESINVLKDAASASIYGSRAANGVLLITTKQGGERDLEVNMSVYTGMQYPKQTISFVNAYDAAILGTEARNKNYMSNFVPGSPTVRSESDDEAARRANGAGKNQLLLPYLKDYVDGVKGLTDTDWVDAIYAPAPITNYYVSLSGGTKKTNYFTSFGYLKQEGVLIGTAMDKATSNIRLNSNISDKLKFGVSLNTSYSSSDITGESTSTNRYPSAPASSLYMMAPFFPVYNEDGSLAVSKQIEGHSGTYSGNPSENIVAMALLSDNTKDKFRSFGNAFLEYEIINDLKVKTLVGGDFRTSKHDFFRPAYLVGEYRKSADNSSEAWATEKNATTDNILTETTVNYNKSFGEHGFTLLGGYSFQKENYRYTEVKAISFPNNNVPNIAGGAEATVNSYRSKWTQESFFGRLQYDYAGKYLMSASIRTDGSSRFGDDTKWGMFSSASFGWWLSKEKFFPENDVLTSVKLRGSWGQTGNNQIGSYAAQSLIGESNYNVGGSLVSGLVGSTAPNSGLSWETSVSKNIGVDLSFFNNQILFSSEYYITNTKDLLLSVPVPQHTGYSSSLQNIGEIQNKGFEFELKGQNYKFRGVTINFNANLSTNSNKVLALGPDQEQIIKFNTTNFRTKVGGSLSEIYVYKTDGIYKTQEEIDNSVHIDGTLTGDYVLVDTDNDGKITTDDRVGVGTYAPDFNYAFGAGFKYKNFDFSFQFEGVEGRKVVSHFFAQTTEGTGFNNVNQYYFDNRYHPINNPDGFLAQPNRQRSNAKNFASKTNMDIYVQDGDYLRLRTVQLGYNFSNKKLQNTGISNLRLYLSANNLFTISKYIGINPEGTSSDALQQGFVRGSNLVPMTIIAGFNITF